MLIYIHETKGVIFKNNSTVRSIQEILNFLGFKYKVKSGKNEEVVRYEELEENGNYDDKTESVIIDFQQSRGLLRDGIVGPITMKALRDAFTNRSKELSIPLGSFAETQAEKFSLDRVYSDKWNGEGYSRFSLRSDVAAQYRKVRKEVTSRGGILTSSGGIRGLNAKLNASRSATSFHYVGRALDLFIFSGMVDPEKDPYVISWEEPRKYRIFARCNSTKWHNEEDPPKRPIDLPERMEVDNIISYKSRKPDKNIHPPQEGYFLDLTAIFEKHGFKPIRARRRFEEGSSMMGAEWWHFQYEEGLVAHFSTFGDELLSIYEEDILEGTPPWKHRNRVFQKDWF